MSIYVTIFTIEDERQWVAGLEAQGIGAGVIRDGEPTPDDLDAPLVYQGSHILPAENDPRGGSVSLAGIPSHITRDGRDDQPEDETPWPYLRLSVNDADVVLTVRQADRLFQSLASCLTETANSQSQPHER